MALKFSNNASSLLAADISNIATTVTVTSGTGALFPTTADGTFLVTVQDSTGNNEIMLCTARTTDSLTVTRAQEGTIARAFSAGAMVENRFTAGSIDSFARAADVQPIDAGLTSISGLTTAADKIIYTTAADTYATASCTAAGRALLDDANAAAQRTTLGLVIGTNVQAYDSTILKSANIGSTVQAYDVDTAKIDVQQAWTKPQRSTVSSVNIASAFDASAYAAIKHTLAVNTTVAAPSNTPIEGDELYLHITGASTYTLAWNTTYKARADLALPSAPGVGKVLSVCFRYDGTNWQMIGYRKDA